MSYRSCLNKLNSSSCCSGCFPPGWWLEVIKAHPAVKQVFNYLNIFRSTGEFFLLWCSNRATPYHIHNILLSTRYISRHSLIRVHGVYSRVLSCIATLEPLWAGCLVSYGTKIMVSTLLAFLVNGYFLKS